MVERICDDDDIDEAVETPPADHPGPPARRVHPQGQGAQARLHGRLGPPEAQRPGPAHGAVQGPVQEPRRAGRTPHRVALTADTPGVRVPPRSPPSYPPPAPASTPPQYPRPRRLEPPRCRRRCSPPWAHADPTAGAAGRRRHRPRRVRGPAARPTGCSRSRPRRPPAVAAAGSACSSASPSASWRWSPPGSGSCATDSPYPVRVGRAGRRPGRLRRGRARPRLRPPRPRRLPHRRAVLRAHPRRRRGAHRGGGGRDRAGRGHAPRPRPRRGRLRPVRVRPTTCPTRARWRSTTCRPSASSSGAPR